jgi:hypothetical protein
MKITITTCAEMTEQAKAELLHMQTQGRRGLMAAASWLRRVRTVTATFIMSGLRSCFGVGSLLIRRFNKSARPVRTSTGT